jgi:hypothetical protein
MLLALPLALTPKVRSATAVPSVDPDPLGFVPGERAVTVGAKVITGRHCTIADEAAEQSPMTAFVPMRCRTAHDLLVFSRANSLHVI